MTSRDDGPRPEDQDDDPTGVRELLSGLPDPGPMPDHVAARIAATLDEHDPQRDGRSSGTAASPRRTATGQARGGSDVSFGVARQRLPRGPWLVAGAAAVVTVGVVGVATYDRMVGLGEEPEIAAQYVPASNTRTGESSEREDKAEQSPSASASQGAAVDEGADHASGDGVAAAALAQIDERSFAAGAGAVLEGAAAGTEPRSLPASFEPIEAGVRALPAAQTENCVRATGETPNGPGWVAAPATVAQTDVVVVSDASARAPRAWAVSADCVADPSASVLHGPTDLP
ncbi:MAG TPA: hypothetical protein VJ976_11295 [Ornithinimicrobium sp.]|uniref:hypothetical protein n=1 Tax=Ornithinimicrobium sp. TaxID=1977084 RepID=UPI002B45FEC4|nr:hypothetical protein [Ornithinimicrobium sp.]HKJ12956.1 hypothetical protein [Ornithinimicrobium sp.]